MKKVFLFILVSFTAIEIGHAQEGSWFALGTGYEYLAAGRDESGTSFSMEGGYWYLGNVAYGAQAKASFFGDSNRIGSSDFRTYDLGVFWKAGTEDGLYAKIISGLTLFNGRTSQLRTESSRSFYIGVGAGALFQITDALHIGPEVLYRHLTAGDGGDQISVGVLVAHRF